MQKLPFKILNLIIEICLIMIKVWFISSSKSRRFVAIDEWSIPNFAISTWSTKIFQNRFNDGREWLSAGQRAVGGWNKVVLFSNSSNSQSMNLNENNKIIVFSELILNMHIIANLYYHNFSNLARKWIKSEFQNSINLTRILPKNYICYELANS